MSLAGVDVANAVGGLALETSSNEVCTLDLTYTVITYIPTPGVMAAAATKRNRSQLVVTLSWNGRKLEGNQCPGRCP